MDARTGGAFQVSRNDIERIPTRAETLRMTASIVGAFAAYNTTLPEQLPDIIRTVHQALESLVNGNPRSDAERPKPVVPINKSVHDDHIVCLNDGRKLKMLKRYLRARHGMSPEENRRYWGLPADYPMVALNYAARRSEFAKKIGLGKGVRRKD